jgi:hypothetical protein
MKPSIFIQRQADEKQEGEYMLMNQKSFRNDEFAGGGRMGVSAAMAPDALLIDERIREITMMCDRENPIYEQIGGFSIALYPIGFFDGDDLMSVPDLDFREAAAVLSACFEEVSLKDIPPDYHISAAGDHYLMVIGDPMFPDHFALLVDNRSPRPFFSKLQFFGSGFDSLAELVEAFPCEDPSRVPEIHYYRKIRFGEVTPASKGRIYIVKNDDR